MERPSDSPSAVAPGRWARIVPPTANPSFSLNGATLPLPPACALGRSADAIDRRRPVGVLSSATVYTLLGNGYPQYSGTSGSHSRSGHSTVGSTSSPVDDPVLGSSPVLVADPLELASTPPVVTSGPPLDDPSAAGAESPHAPRAITQTHPRHRIGPILPRDRPGRQRGRSQSVMTRAHVA